VAAAYSLSRLAALSSACCSAWDSALFWPSRPTHFALNSSTAPSQTALEHNPNLSIFKPLELAMIHRLALGQASVRVVPRTLCKRLTMGLDVDFFDPDGYDKVGLLQICGQSCAAQPNSITCSVAVGTLGHQYGRGCFNAPAEYARVFVL
jgi:hypothetical protein